MRSFLIDYGTFVVLLLLCLVLHLLSPVFLTGDNLRNILVQSSVNAVLAVGMTFVILTAGIDLSVGSVLALSGVVMGDLLHRGVPVPVALLAALAVGGACGLANGALVTRGKLPPFIVTLGMMSVARGLALVYAGGQSVSGFPASFKAISNAAPLGVPLPVVFMLAVVAVAHLALTRTKAGRYVYAIGGNAEASWLSGVNVPAYTTLVYVVAGLLSGLAAILFTARIDTAQPIAGQMYELDAIAATVIGGTSLMGGEGTVIGTLVGALIIGVLRNGLNILGVSPYTQQVVIGAVIIGAVFLDRLKHRLVARAPAGDAAAPARGRAKAGVLVATGAVLALAVGLSILRPGGESALGPRSAVFIMKTLNNPFFIDMEKAARAEAERQGITLVVQAPERETDVEKQMQMVENAIVQGPAVLIITPSGSKEIIAAVKKANARGIPVIVVDTRVDAALAASEGAETATFIGSDNRDGGRRAGRAIAKALGDAGKVAVLEGIAGHETADARKGGFLEVVAQNPGLEVVASQPANWEQGLGFDVFQNMLQAHPEIQALFACNDRMALGALEAARAAGREDIVICGFDASDDAIASIRAGGLRGSVAQYPGEMGRMAIAAAARLMAGEEIEAELPTKVELITRENLPGE